MKDNVGSKTLHWLVLSVKKKPEPKSIPSTPQNGFPFTSNTFLRNDTYPNILPPANAARLSYQDLILPWPLRSPVFLCMPGCSARCSEILAEL